jgi:hypothetical protein
MDGDSSFDLSALLRSMQLTVELSEMPFPESPFTKLGRPGEIVGRRA